MILVSKVYVFQVDRKLKLESEIGVREGKGRYIEEGES